MPKSSARAAPDSDSNALAKTQPPESFAIETNDLISEMSDPALSR
jgi:hypothetical protein